jgi:hypothetical protein
MRRQIIEWYRGKYKPRENDPYSPLVFVGGSYKRHWTSRVAHVLVDFYLREWRWIMAAFCAPFTLAVLKHFLM